MSAKKEVISTKQELLFREKAKEDLPLHYDENYTSLLLRDGKLMFQKNHNLR